MALAMAVALGLDAAIGWPKQLEARIGHPVMWMGAWIDRLDRRMNREKDAPRKRRIRGVMAVAIAVLGVMLAAAIVQLILPNNWIGGLIAGVLAWPLIAVKSLHTHVKAVVAPLVSGNLDAARAEVAKIVGRDPASLDKPGLTRAALESLGENSSDGVLAPVFWGVVLGLPGIVGYKMINTLDSMIGHRTPRHEAFGWAAARLDDVANFIPARITALLLCLTSGQATRSLITVAADASSHRSPNAGWPEAALAGALDVRLSGPRIYDGKTVDEPWINGTAPDPTPTHLITGLKLYRRAMIALGVVLLLFAAL